MKIKLITPPGMLLTVALLVIYSAYAFLIGSIENSYPLLVGGMVAVAASYGVAMLRPWSRNLVYLLMLGLLLKLGSSFVESYQSGFFALHYDSTAAALRSLGPTVAMTLLFAVACGIVHFQFRKPNQ